VALFTCGAAAACATNPATGERQLVLIPEQQEIQMGREASVQVRETLGLVDDEELQAYVERIGIRLATMSERPDLPWAFGVVEDPTPNAFALPGGFIYITRGLMTLLTSEAEMAAILGHEIAHVTARHAVNQISKQQVAQLGLGLGAIIFPETQPLGPVLGASLDLLFLKYGRDDERQADSLGFDYMQEAGYATSEAADVFAVLERVGGEQRSALPTWLSTHPSPGERVQAAQKRAEDAAPQPNARVEREAFLREIDGLVYGENPRNGFFEEERFYHPEMQFQIEFPGGWRTQNMAQAVIGIERENQAALQLTLAGTASAEAALTRFFAEEGIRAGRSSRETINGLPAAVAEFEATTASGLVRGLVAYIEHRGRTFQVLGYSAASRYPQYQGAFSGAIRSFATVSDPEVLSVEPRRLDIVTVPAAQTLAEFAVRFSSVVPVDELALINQLPDGTTRLPAGMQVKRVVG
jgi:predicted Zn-dependent protease